MSNFTPAREDVELMHYFRDQGSALDRDNVLLKWLAKRADAQKHLEAAIENYVRAEGVVYAMQLIREYGALPQGKVKR